MPNNTETAPGAISLTPTSWFHDPLGTVNETDWPWAHLTIDDWQNLLSILAPLDSFINWMVQISNAACWVGFIGSILIFVTVFSKRRMIRNSFYLSLVIVAALDLIFVLLKFFRWIILQLKPKTKAGILFYNYASGVTYTCSLMADMITLSLTLERYVALAAPIFHKNLSHRKKRLAWFISGIVSFLIACTRMHYSFDTVIFGDANLQKQAWFVGISYFSDNVIPFLLTVIMLFLIAGISKTLLKRRKQKKTRVQPNDDAQLQRQEKATSKTISLLAALLVMYFTNQLGYMLYATGVLMIAEQSLTYSSSFPEIRNYVYVYKYYIVAAYLSSPMEVVSRAMVFYTYLLFSHAFRNDFIKGMRKCGPWKLQQMGVTTVASMSAVTRIQMTQIKAPMETNGIPPVDS